MSNAAKETAQLFVGCMAIVAIFSMTFKACQAYGERENKLFISCLEKATPSECAMARKAGM